MSTRRGERDDLEVLREMYEAQMRSPFPDDAMPKVMEKLSLSEEEAIAYVKQFLAEGLLKRTAMKPAYFLRPGYIHCFPLTVSSAGLQRLKESAEKG